mgnify:CR=1 FL=1
MSLIRKIHHVAYRCRDAAETVGFYREVLGMDFTIAFAEDFVPSTGEPDPYMHVFMDAGGGNVLAFFELPNSAPMGRDTNTPEWVQHIALEVDDAYKTCDDVRARGGKVVLISDAEGLAEAGEGCIATIEMPKVHPLIAPLVYAVPVQLLAYHVAVAKGTDVDQPRNLAKSVTVE